MLFLKGPRAPKRGVFLLRYTYVYGTSDTRARDAKIPHAAGRRIAEVGEVIEFSGVRGASAIAAVMFDDDSFNVVGKNFDGTFTLPRASQYSWILREARYMPEIDCDFLLSVRVWVTPSTYLALDHVTGHWVFSGIMQIREPAESGVSAHLH